LVRRIIFRPEVIISACLEPFNDAHGARGSRRLGS
jgi:hypothetical protein